MHNRFSIARPNPWTLTACIALAVVLTSGCDRNATDDPRRARPEAQQWQNAHERMLSVLEQIKSRISQDNDFLGDADLIQLKHQLAAQPQHAYAMRGALMFEIGTKNVFLGNTSQGIEEQKAAFELLRQAGVPQSVFDKLFFSIGVSHLRKAENDNCILAHSAGSCIFPIRGDGVHADPEQATRAIAYFSRVLESQPGHLPSRWLLNLSYMALGRYPDDVPQSFLIPPKAFESEQAFPRFIDCGSNLGLDTVSLAGGVITDDFDDDGFLDIMVSSWSPADQIRMFHNDGDGRFSDWTQQSGLTGLYGGLNLIHADYDNDGDIDVLVLRGGWLGDAGRHPNSLLQNDGRGRFRDVTFDAGLGNEHFPTQTASWADYDNDGDLDLYVGNEGFANQLFQNQADGTFIDVAPDTGVADAGFTKGVIWGDFDHDRFPDVYVSNLDGPNRLFRNLGNGSFEDVASRLGVTGPQDSFPTWFWDFNNDGALDLFVASFSQSVDPVAADFLNLHHGTEMDRLYQGDGKGGFADVAEPKNLRRVTQPMGSNFGDLDNDGFLDFYLGTGFPDFEALVPNQMFRNDGGRSFLNVTSAGGFGHLQKGHGVAFADLDNDGDQDVFHELGGWFAGDAYGDALFENPGFENHWIVIKLVGQQSNACAIGARIRIDLNHDTATRSIYRWVNSGGSFGGNPLRQHIGLGKNDQISRLEIQWPTTGTTQVFENINANQFLRITEGRSDIESLPYKKLTFSKSPAATSDHSHHHHAGAGRSM
ncbi:ASPIC and UnbV [Stieleria maiorica]|uniref:ASPIC and UnbV n=1 Tax=Stieleria maiorica TaxID=2795974 RepID=A0A5B9MM28_9BACT|nr:CRTAC1 family protein [Stieleria maiorica]QEG01071.1 ASPIC and UnbV [Stieleria maiorica]